MKQTAFALGFTWALMLVAFKLNDCPPHYELGQTYAQVQTVCPAMEKQARWADSTSAAYLCPTDSVVVVGSKYTGKSIGFFKWNGQ